jgi:hypothetical protein
MCFGYSVMIRSAHSISHTKIAGLPDFASQSFKSVSVTPRAQEQIPQEKYTLDDADVQTLQSQLGGSLGQSNLARAQTD